MHRGTAAVSTENTRASRLFDGQLIFDMAFWAQVNNGRTGVDRLRGKVAIVTGAGGGIGGAIAMAFAGEGEGAVGDAVRIGDHQETGGGQIAAGFVDLGHQRQPSVISVHLKRTQAGTLIRVDGRAQMCIF